MRATVGVFPSEHLRRRSRLFQTLSALFAVDFRELERVVTDDLDGLVVFGQAPSDPWRVPTLHYAGDGIDTAGTSPPSDLVQLGRSERIDARLRTCRLGEHVPRSVPRLTDGVPLAYDDVGTLWAAAADGNDAETAALAPQELEPGQPLRELLQAGRFVSLLPLVHLLRRVTKYHAWHRPAPRATVVFDDPNLHWTSYGYVHFERLARHAAEHGYHASIAMVPLDGWFARRRAVQTFQRQSRRLSLAIHGNDHTYCELDAPLPLERALPVLDQALRRTASFERRTGLRVDRVMIPPHGLCSDEMLEALVASGFEALCRAPVWWEGWPAERRQRASWAMTDVSPAGAPILGRRLISEPRLGDDLRFDLFLDRPTIVYGHHGDLRDGYEVLSNTADLLEDVPGLEWVSLATLARTGVMTRSDGERLNVRAFSRRASVKLPAGATTVELELPVGAGSEADVLECDGSAYELLVNGDVARATVPVADGATSFEFRVRRPPTVRGPALALSARALARRAAVELRDRSTTVLGR